MVKKLDFKQVFIVGLNAAALSSIINVILFFLFHNMKWITDDIFIQPNQPMTVIIIIMASIFPSIFASLVYFLFEKYTQNGYRIFRNVSIILMLLSLTSPFTVIPNVTPLYAISLSVMHLVVPLVLLYFIYRRKNTNS